ncbi:MAG: NUDIX hydrolase [Chromatiales bacterium 21-64-14]|nr:MAG: NUDIX hydrolase [Chromatiales bacterium 21-64-14]HQU16407.1 NUDIX hydrolase [Gammaproteobacteria bacterium]
MTWKPHVTVATLAERDGRFLVVEEEIRGRLVFNQPAGHLDPGESLVQAAIRETLEETAWHFQPRWLTGIYRWVEPSRSVTFLRFCFAGTCDRQEPGRTLDAGIHRALWLTRAELEAHGPRHRSPLVLRCLEDYQAGHRYPLELLQDLGDGAEIR